MLEHLAKWPALRFDDTNVKSFESVHKQSFPVQFDLNRNFDTDESHATKGFFDKLLHDGQHNLAASR
jgi:hypothetical protein